MAADIHALELEFAKNPTLDACIPLCEAYLAQKRFMEAMVVCKKGIKSATQDARGRVMLARVYAEQGKAPKAQQEMEQALTEIPNNPLLLEMLGKLFMDQGRRDEAVARLQQALGIDPNLVNARGFLQQLGVAAPAAAAAPVAPLPRAAAPAGAPPPRPMAPQAFGQPAAVPMHGAPQAFGQPAAAPAGWAAPPAQAFQGAPVAAPAPMPMSDSGSNRPLEHVSDFFAQDTLGFSSDATGIETAGPGRLTILGFVPKSTGSIKTTLFVAIGVLAFAGGFIFYQYKNSQETREINKKVGEMRVALDEDKSVRYKDAIRVGDDILKIDDEQNLTLGGMAYAYAVLAVDFKEDGALAKSKDYLQRAEKASHDENEYRVAARALIAFAEKRYEQGIIDVKKIMDKGGSKPIVELEAFRLMNEMKPDDKDTQVQMRRLVQSVATEARIYNFLGWYWYLRDDWAQADKNFSSALQNVRGHPQALIGSALTDLDRGIALQERQKEIEKNIKAVLSLPPEELTPAITALAYFARAQLLLWQEKMPDAQADYKQAFKLDGDNAMFYYRLGASLLKLGNAQPAIENLRKAVAKEPNNVRYLKLLADAQMRGKDADGAKATLERAAQLSAGDTDTKILEGDRLRYEKKYPDAIAAYKKITREDGGIPFSLAQIGISQTMRESGKKAEAASFMKDYLGNVAGGVDPGTQAKLWCEYGQNLEAQHEHDGAIDAYQNGIDQFRYYPNCHFYMCRIMGKGPEATESCKLYLTLAPRGEFAAEAKKRVGGAK